MFLKDTHYGYTHSPGHSSLVRNNCPRGVKMQEGVPREAHTRREQTPMFICCTRCFRDWEGADLCGPV